MSVTLESLASRVEDLEREVALLRERAGRSPSALAEAKRAAVNRKDSMGMLAHLGLSLTKEDIDEGRREAWANFPRDFPERPPQ